MESITRTYRFMITFEVEPSHSAYDDPEWAADAAHGALTNEFGLRAIYTDITVVSDRQSLRVTADKYRLANPSSSGVPQALSHAPDP